MRWVARGWRPLVCTLPGVLLAAALAVATPSVVAAAPATVAAPHPTHCVPAGGPNTCAGLHAKAGGAGVHHGIKRRIVHPLPAPPPPPTTAPPGGPLLVAIFVNNAEFAAIPLSRVVPPAPALTLAPRIGARAAPPRLGGVLSVPQPSLFGGLGLGPGDAGAELGVWQVIAGAEGVALLALVTALLRRRRVAARRDR